MKTPTAAMMSPRMLMTTAWMACFASLTVILAGKGEDDGRVSCQDARVRIAGHGWNSGHCRKRPSKRG